MKWFGKGLITGGVIGAGLMWLNTTTKGRALREEILTVSHKVYDKVKADVQSSEQWQDLTKSQYVQKVHDAVNTYAVETGIADSVAQLVKKVVSAQYARLKKELS